MLRRPSAQDEVQVLPQDRIAAVRPFWETLSKVERRQLLTLCIDDLHERAVLLTDRYQKQAGERCLGPRRRLRAGAGPDGERLLASADSASLVSSLQLRACCMLHHLWSPGCTVLLAALLRADWCRVSRKMCARADQSQVVRNSNGRF